MTDLSHWDDGAEFDQLSDELRRQDEKWGQQDHEDGTGHSYFRRKAEDIKGYNDLAEQGAEGFTRNWAAILHEEVYEALSETDPKELSKELNEVAAVCLQWRKAIERRRQEDLDLDAESFRSWH